MTFQFMSNVTEVLDFFLKLPQIRSSNFRQVVRQHTEGTKGSITWFVGNILFFPAVKEFWKSVKNWQNYRREFGVLLFGDTVYFSPMKNYPRITLPWNIYVRQRPPPVSPMFLPHETPPPWKFTVTLFVCAATRDLLTIARFLVLSTSNNSSLIGLWCAPFATVRSVKTHWTKRLISCQKDWRWLSRQRVVMLNFVWTNR